MNGESRLRIGYIEIQDLSVEYSSAFVAGSRASVEPPNKLIAYSHMCDSIFGPKTIYCGACSDQRDAKLHDGLDPKGLRQWLSCIPARIIFSFHFTGRNSVYDGPVMEAPRVLRIEKGAWGMGDLCF